MTARIHLLSNQQWHNRCNVLYHPESIYLPQTCPWKNCLLWSQSLVPKRLGTTAVAKRAVLGVCSITLLLLLLLSRFSRVRLLATPWTTARQAPPSMGFSRQEYCSGVPLPSQAVSLYRLGNQANESSVKLQLPLRNAWYWNHQCHSSLFTMAPTL